MPLRPIAIAFVVVCLAIAIRLVVGVVRGARSRQWIALLLLMPALACAWLASLPIPYLLGLDTPHPVFNSAAPLPSSAVTYSYLPAIGNAVGGPKLPTLFAIQASTGKIRWQRTMPGVDTFVAQADGVAFVASDDRTASGGVAQIVALDGATGTIVWERLLPGTIVWTPPLIAGGEVLLDATPIGSPPQEGILALSTADGSTLWSAPVGNTHGAPLALRLGPGIVYDQPDPFTFQARDINNGRLLWQIDQVDGRVVAGPDAVYEISGYGAVTALAATTRSLLWSFGDHDDFHAAALDGDTLYVTAQHSGQNTDASGKLINPETVYALDAHTGAVRWAFATQSIDSGSLAVCHGAIFIQADDGVHALGSSDGHVLWPRAAKSNWTFGTFAPNSSCVGSTAYFTALENLPPETVSSLFEPVPIQTYLYAVDATTGSLYWSIPVGPVFHIQPRFVI